MLGLASAITITATSAVFSNPLEDAVKARQAYYQVVKSNAGPLFGMMKGDVAYDAENATTYANNLKTLAALNNAHMWKKGSDKEALPGKTRALASIWADGSDIGKLASDWRAAIDELVKVAGEGKDAMTPKMAAVGKGCAACHKAHRAKDF